MLSIQEGSNPCRVLAAQADVDAGREMRRLDLDGRRGVAHFIRPLGDCLVVEAAIEQRVRSQHPRLRGEYRLRQAVEHAGAQLRDFSEHRDVYRVTYQVDGRRHTSIIRKNDLTVQSAGICLSGGQNFD